MDKEINNVSIRSRLNLTPTHPKKRKKKKYITHTKELAAQMPSSVLQRENISLWTQGGNFFRILKRDLMIRRFFDLHSSRVSLHEDKKTLIFLLT